ncbi:MAG: glycogen/starch/alpha-glucan phosphorylase [Alphaproteobacteria bacterium]
MTPKKTTKFEAQDNVSRLTKSIEQHLKYSIGKRPCEATNADVLTAIALATREYAIDGMFDTAARHEKSDTKRVYYLSVEFLIGRSLENNLRNLGIYDDIKKVKIEGLDIDIDSIFDLEYDPALGNGGLGRLAACFLDSMATLGIPGFGYGINYQFGLFKQAFENGYQIERADSWLDSASPWQIERHERSIKIPFYGSLDDKGFWTNCEYLIGVPFDMPIVGYGGNTINYLRLFSACSSDDLDIATFNDGGYMKAVEQKIKSETVSKVLYPSDAVEAGKKLRLTQQYFFVSCAIHDIIRRFLEKNDDLRDLPNKVAIQLNDTHPALAVPEMMRVSMDERGLDWDTAWEITTNTLAYTNHTLLPEALEQWSVSILETVLPRHMKIIYEINHRFIEQINSLYPSDMSKLSKMSIISEGEHKKVRMANLAIIGSHAVNGVAELHSELIKKNLVPDFYELWPQKFQNKTNGITPRRWLLTSNPELSALISSKIGDGWITNLEEIKKIEPFADDPAFIKQFLEIKALNKKKLAKIIFDKTNVKINVNSIFDVQAKRIHEYKRQLLNALNIIHQYYSIIKDGKKLAYPRTYIFGGKAAPSYKMAKLIIKLINNIAKTVNNDPRVKNQIKVVFIPDYKVSVAERIFPAADVSEQISTAGFEASGTGNMKFALNGALTIGTLDGANIEIREEVGEDNFYLFGLTAEEVQKMQQSGQYDPWHYYNNNSNIRRIMNSLASIDFCEGEAGTLFKPIYDSLMNRDYYFLLADLESYIKTQDAITEDFVDRDEWARRAILNIARISKFSSDRTILEYAKEIWGAEQVL